jgi:acyl-CoA synthetase (AMP-forming)/AMP-acid ligase II
MATREQYMPSSVDGPLKREKNVSVAALHDGLARAASRFGERDFVRAGDERWSFRELDERSTAFARHLAAAGVDRGDRVALMATNRVEFVVAVKGISKLGAATVLLSPAWKELEVDHALGLTAPVHAVADGPAVDLLGSRLAVTDLDAPVAEGEPVGVDVDAKDEAVLVFSSGPRRPQAQRCGCTPGSTSTRSFTASRPSA